MTLTILAVDDEPPALREISYTLRQCDSTLTVLEANDVAEALRILREQVIDAIFLDINMPGLSGIDLAHVLRQFKTPPAIVFVTALEDRAVEAFELDAVDYVVKPFRTERIARALHKVVDGGRVRTATSATAPQPVPTAPSAALQTGSAALGRIAVERGGETRFLRPDQVLYAEANGDYVRLHTVDDGYLVRVPLSELEARWADEFVRVHRAYLVQLGAITALRTDGGKYSIEVGGDDRKVEIPVSRRHARTLRESMVHRANGAGQ